MQDRAVERAPLSRTRVLEAAVALADRDGLDGLTMRALGEDLGVEAMSLYHHVANKAAILDGVVDTVIAEVHAVAADLAAPTPDDEWQVVLRARILLARRVMLRHPWAPELIQRQTAPPGGVIVWMDQVLGILFAGGFSTDLAHHSMHALGSRALGFTQELFAPDASTDDDGADEALAALADRVPNIVRMLADVVHDDPDTTLGWCDDQTEFEFGLDVLLDGLERRRMRS